MTGDRSPRRRKHIRSASAPGDTRLLWPWEGYDPAPLDGVREIPTWIGSQDRPLFGWLSVPASGAITSAVVLCPPVGEEARSTHRTMRRLGSELARRGIAALRVDYHGTGDSSGLQHEPDRVAAWEDSIAAAADELRVRGARSVGLIGMRIGATLGAAVAARGGFDDVVLWDPCISGRAWLRESAALHNLGDYRTAHRDDGGTDTPGFTYEPDTVADLQRVALKSLPADPWCARLLVLTRDGEPPLGAAGASLRQPHVQWATATGQEDLIGVEPNQARSPLGTVTEIVDWMAAGASSPSQLDCRQTRRAMVTDPDTGSTVRETIVALGPNALFGIVTEPLHPAPDAPWILLVNVAIEVHIGPGRCWVDYARSWAAMGLRCVRFDQSGLGDSPRWLDQREDVMFDAHWLDDVPHVIDALSPGRAPVALFGLCSGAYSAFEAAMRRPVDAVYALSVRLSAAEMAPGQPAYSAQRIAARAFVAPLGRLFQRDTRAAWALWRAYRQIAVWHAPMSSVLALLRTGTTLRVVADRKDAEGFREVLWWSAIRRWAVTRTRRYALRVVPDLDHALMTQPSQRLAYADATAFWRRQYAQFLSASDLSAEFDMAELEPVSVSVSTSDPGGDPVSARRYRERR